MTHRIVRFSLLVLTLSLFSAGASSSSERDSFNLQLRWTAQSPFMGFYVADALGFYEAEGLDITIMPGSSEIDPLGTLASHEADAAVEWLVAALVEKEKGRGYKYRTNKRPIEIKFPD